MFWYSSLSNDSLATFPSSLVVSIDFFPSLSSGCLVNLVHFLFKVTCLLLLHSPFKRCLIAFCKLIFFLCRRRRLGVAVVFLRPPLSSFIYPFSIYSFIPSFVFAYLRKNCVSSSVAVRYLFSLRSNEEFQLGKCNPT